MRKILIAALAFAFIGAANAQTFLSGGTFLSISISDGAVHSLGTIPSSARGAQICNEGVAFRYTDDGATTPTATVGLVWAGGSPTAPTCFAYFGPLSFFKMIQTSSGGGPVDVSWYQ